MSRAKPQIDYHTFGSLDVAQRKDGQRIICAGSRDWTDTTLIFNALMTHDLRLRIDYIIHGNNGYDAFGNCLDQIDSNESDLAAIRGADKLSGKTAIRMYIPVLRFVPDWRHLGRKAGPSRNEQMIRNGLPTYALLFHDDIRSSKGTWNMKMLLEQYNIPHEIVRHE